MADDVVLTERQREVLTVIADAMPRGIPCAWIAEQVYPPTSKMRRYRPSRGASNWQGAQGGLGNLAIGRVCAALERKGMARHNGDSSRWVVTVAGVWALGRQPLTDEDDY